MNKIVNVVLREPVLAAAIGFVVAGYGVLEAFGVSLTTDQQAALSAFGLAVIAVATAVRKAVTPNKQLASNAACPICGDATCEGCDSGTCQHCADGSCAVCAE